MLGWVAAALLAIGNSNFCGIANGQSPDLQTSGLIESAPSNSTLASPIADSPSADPIEVSGNSVHRWQIGTSDATWVRGNAQLRHGDRHWTAESFLIVTDGPVGSVVNRIVAEQLMGSDGTPRTWVQPTMDDPRITAQHYLGPPAEDVPLMQFLTTPGVPSTSQPTVQSTQYTESFAPPTELNAPPLASGIAGGGSGESVFVVGGGTKTIKISGRGPSSPFEINTIPRRELGEDVLIARGGVTVLVQDVQLQVPGMSQITNLDAVSISAERIVAWTPPLANLFTGDSDISQADGELYLEGDVVFRAGQQIIYAEAMYYNVAKEVGMILDAEAIIKPQSLTNSPDFQGDLRLKSEVMQQVAKGNFLAFDAAVTTSRMGVPRYWLQSERLQVSNQSVVRTDPLTGNSFNDTRTLLDSENNFVYMGGIPVIYWPSFSTALDFPSFYLSGINVKNDSVFGTQALLEWNLFQLLGVNDPPPGVEWNLSTDFLSERGPALGTSLEYRVPSLFGIAGPVVGTYDSWYIKDSGQDTLGFNRRNLEPERDFRGRTLLRHRHYLPADYELIAEAGLISDRNFLEQYFENEWDNQVDQRTALRLRRYYGANLFDLSLQGQVNDFYDETERLPRLDHYLLGGAVLGDRFTWSMHNRAGYEQLNPADPPSDLALSGGNFPITPGVSERSGVIAGTRHEIALPMEIGPLKVVPNVTGEASHFGEAADGDNLTRLVGGGGIRTNLPMWRADADVQSSLLNVRGLAHKVDWQAEYMFSDSSTNFDEVPYYDSLDDNAQEEFRRRFTFDAFGGTLPDRFDPRTYAIRHGYQGLIASPSDSLADDVQLLRLGVHQRFQTKRGLQGSERIVDLFEFDVDSIFYPNADSDNFGESIGPTTYNSVYRLGDRVSLLSDGYFDFFSDGLKSISGGVRTSRPGLGDVYIGLLSIEGPISSMALRSNVNYRLNEKWIATAAAIYDFNGTGNIGQSLALTRIGESFLVRLGINVDSGRDNVGFGFALEPRFLPRGRLGRLGGEKVAQTGMLGLE
jgi:hypothetical protein